MEISPSCIFFYCLRFISMLNFECAYFPQQLGSECPGRCSWKGIRCTLPKSLYQLYKPRDGGESGESYFYGVFFPVREENKTPLTWWPMTNYHLLLPQGLSRGLAFPVLPLLLLPSAGIFFKPCFRWKCNSLAWMNTDTDLSKLLSHFKLSDS